MENILDKVKEAEELLNGFEILGSETARATALRQKLEEGNLTVSVIGQFKRGKSTLINAVLGDEILPAGIVPVTSAVTRINYGEKAAFIRFRNGVEEKVPFEDLEKYVNEQNNPGNDLGVDSLNITMPSAFLADGITLVDTPGVGSFHKNNSEAAYAFVKESDAVIFMLSVDSPINEIEIDFLHNTREYAGKFFFVVNKTDTISSVELQSYLAYCRMLLKNLMNSEDIVLYPVSAKTGDGLAALKDTLSVDLKRKTREILEESARLKLIDITGCALSQIDLYWKVLLMPPVVLKSTLKNMQNKLQAMRNEASELVHSMEADRDIIIPGLSKSLAARLNEFKIELSASVTDIFGMDYHYEIAQIPQMENENEYELASKLGRDYLSEMGRLTDELANTLETVLMYRNSDTFEVVDRVYKLNTLTRTLRRTRRQLGGED